MNLMTVGLARRTIGRAAGWAAPRTTLPSRQRNPTCQAKKRTSVASPCQPDSNPLKKAQPLLSEPRSLRHHLPKTPAFQALPPLPQLPRMYRRNLAKRLISVAWKCLNNSQSRPRPRFHRRFHQNRLKILTSTARFPKGIPDHPSPSSTIRLRRRPHQHRLRTPLRRALTLRNACGTAVTRLLSSPPS